MQGASFVAEYASFLSVAHPSISAQLLAELMPNRYRSSRWIIESLLKAKVEANRVAVVGDGYGAYLIPMLVAQFRPSTIAFVGTKASLDVARTIHTHLQSSTNLVWLDDTADITSTDMNMVIAPRCDDHGNIDHLRIANNKCVYVAQGSNKTTSNHPTSNVDELHAGSGIIQFAFKDSLSLNSESRQMVIGTKSVF